MCVWDRFCRETNINLVVIFQVFYKIKGHQNRFDVTVCSFFVVFFLNKKMHDAVSTRPERQQLCKLQNS